MIGCYDFVVGFVVVSCDDLLDDLLGDEWGGQGKDGIIPPLLWTSVGFIGNFQVERGK